MEADDVLADDVDVAGPELLALFAAAENAGGGAVVSSC